MAKKKNTQKAENQASVKQEILQTLERPYPKLQVQFDMGYEGTYNPVSDEKSQTVPDLNLTVRQLLNNHSRGLSNDRHMKDPIYFDIKIPKIKDLTDVQDYKDYLKEQITHVDQFINDEVNAKKEKIEEDNFKQPGKQLDLEEESKKEDEPSK